MRGRKPKPTALHKQDGTLNVTRHKSRKKEPVPPGRLRTAPAWMSATQRAGWDYAVRNAPPSLLRRLDRSVLVVWVVAEDLHRQAAQKLAESAPVVASPKTGEPIANPYLAVLNRQAQIMMKAAAEMGFTPSSRARVNGGGAGDEDPEADDEFGRIAAEVGAPVKGGGIH